MKRKKIQGYVYHNDELVGIINKKGNLFITAPLVKVLEMAELEKEGKEVVLDVSETKRERHE